MGCNPCDRRRLLVMLMGPSGAGKSTVGRLFKTALDGGILIEMSDLIREEAVRVGVGIENMRDFADQMRERFGEDYWAYVAAHRAAGLRTVIFSGVRGSPRTIKSFESLLGQAAVKVFVSSPIEIRRERVASRAGISVAELGVLDPIDSEFENLEAYCDYVVRNDATMTELAHSVRAICAVKNR